MTPLDTQWDYGRQEIVEMFIGLAIGLPAGFALVLGYHLVRDWRRELSRRRFERLLK